MVWFKVNGNEKKSSLFFKLFFVLLHFFSIFFPIRKLREPPVTNSYL